MTTIIPLKIQIKVEIPPVAERCVKEFGITPTETFFAYAGAIYNPGNNPIAFHVLAHEATHIHQQSRENMTPDKWWDMYFSDVSFRLGQETEAYAVQYQSYCKKIKDRNSQGRFLWWCAGQLACDFYGKMVTTNEAINIIKNFNFKKHD